VDNSAVKFSLEKIVSSQLLYKIWTFSEKNI